MSNGHTISINEHFSWVLQHNSIRRGEFQDFVWTLKSPSHFQAPFRLCDRTMFFLNIFQGITIAILSCLQFLHFFCTSFVHFETVWETSPLFHHTFCNYCQYPPCLQPSLCFLFLVPVLARPSSHLPFLFDPLLFNHSQGLFPPISSGAMTNLL